MWAGPSAINGDTVINGIVEAKAVKANKKVEEDNNKLQTLYQRALEKLGTVNCVEGTVYECLLSHDSQATTRALSRYVHFRVHEETDTAALRGKGNAVQDVIAHIKQTVSLCPQFNLVPVVSAGKWILHPPVPFAPFAPADPEV